VQQRDGHAERVARARRDFLRGKSPLRRSLGRAVLLSYCLERQRDERGTSDIRDTYGVCCICRGSRMSGLRVFTSPIARFESSAHEVRLGHTAVSDARRQSAHARAPLYKCAFSLTHNQYQRLAIRHRSPTCQL
jgi:hypothetical protein